MATVTTQERTNILKLVAGMFNAAPGATYLNEFTDAFVALNKDLGALANALGQTGAFKSLYPSFLSAEEFANKFLDTLGLKANTEAQDWVKAKVTAGESYASVIFQALVAIDASTAAEFKAAKDQLTNKTTVAEYYSVEQNKSATDLAALQAVVAKVTNDAATVEAAKAGAAATAGKEFALTTAAGENVVGTVGNDTFSAVATSTGAGYDATNSTLNIGDQIDGGAGTDTLNLILSGTSATAAFAAGSVIKNVEIINVIRTDNASTPAAALTSATFAGVQQLWQVDNAAAGGTFGSVTVGADVTAGFRSTNTATAQAANATVTAAAGTQSALKVALDGVAHNSTLTFSGAGVKTIEVSGSVAAQAAGNAGDLNIANVVTGGGATATIAETIKLSTTSAVDLIIDQTGGAAGNAFGATVKTIDASAATGAIRANATDGAAIDNTVLTGLTSVKLGSGNDNVSFTLGGTKALAIDAGAGNDTITLGGTAAADNLATVTLGAGKDTIVIGANLANLGAGVDTDANLTARITTIADFNKAEDVINLGGTGVALTTAQLDAIKGAATLVAAATAASALAGGVGGQVVFSWGNDAYVYTDAATAGLSTDDSLVKIVGLNAADLTNVQNGNLVL